MIVIKQLNFLLKISKLFLVTFIKWKAIKLIYEITISKSFLTIFKYYVIYFRLILILIQIYFSVSLILNSYNE